MDADIPEKGVTFASRNTACVIALALGGLMVSTQSEAASFSCSRAQTPVEKMICDTPELSQMDDQLAELFAQVRNDSRLPAEARDSILTDQRAWIGQTYGCSDQSCLQALYVTRIDQLQDQQQQLASAPSQEMAAQESAVPEEVAQVSAPAPNAPEETALAQGLQVQPENSVKENISPSDFDISLGIMLTIAAVVLAICFVGAMNAKTIYEKYDTKLFLNWNIVPWFLGIFTVALGVILAIDSWKSDLRVVFAVIIIAPLPWLIAGTINLRKMGLATGLFASIVQLAFSTVAAVGVILILLWATGEIDERRRKRREG